MSFHREDRHISYIVFYYVTRSTRTTFADQVRSGLDPGPGLCWDRRIGTPALQLPVANLMTHLDDVVTPRK